MDPKQTEQINKLASIGLFEAQCLLLQEGGTNYFHENSKSEVSSSPEHSAWLLNADSQAADYYNGDSQAAGEGIYRRVFCKGSMDTSTAAHDLALHEGNMNNQIYSGLISTQNSNISDFFSLETGASAPNDISPLHFLQYGARSSAAACTAQQFDNINSRNPNLPLAAHYWASATGCSWNQQNAALITRSRQTGHDSTSSYDQKEGLSFLDYLHDTSHAPQINKCGNLVKLSASSSLIVHTHAQQGVLRRRSQFVRAAQQLLEEVCNVKSCYDTQSTGVSKAIKSDDSLKSTCRKQQHMSGMERCHMHTRKARLIGMVEELDRSYQQYHDHMQLIGMSFESATGMGAPYTVVAKKFISRQFRVLRDAISEHIHAACTMLGEDISSVPILNKGETPRLRILEQRLRHHRTLQHRQRWRPQRGLPERSVAVLRAWLFEHFLHPYPKDSETLTLARLTGLTRSQVVNWFINARVRLWKPMVEQIYLEESKEAESQNQAGAERYEETSMTEYGSSGGSKGNNVMALAVRENPPKRHHYQHLVHEDSNSRITHSSIMTKHGVSLTPAHLQLCLHGAHNHH